MQRLPSVVLLVGFLVLIASVIVGWLIVPKVINNKISSQVRLLNGSETFQRWRDVPVPIYVKFHLFNLTNHAEFLKGANPVLEQIGPYVYLQKRKKVDIKFNEKNDTVTYRQIMSYIFQPNMSNGTLNDVLTYLNLPLYILAAAASRKNFIGRSIMAEYLASEPPIVNRTIDEMLFKGHYENVVEQLASFSGEQILPNHTFGLQYGKNNTDQGIYEVFSGVKDGNRFGEIASWNGSPDMPWWEDQKCKKIKGTDGSIFAPFVRTDRKLDMYSSDLCRSLRLLYEKDSEVRGIGTYRFTVDPAILEDPIYNRDNMCFCTQPGEKFRNCPKTGAYQLSACKKDAPLLVSLPHFLDGAEQYLGNVTGLTPNRTLHETFVELEPNTGLLLKAAKRIQMNVDLKPFKFIKSIKKLPSLLLPIMWVDESMEVPEAGAQRLQAKLLKPKSIANIISYFGVFLGLVIIAAAALIYLIRARKKNYDT